jgi:heme A synthase
LKPLHLILGLALVIVFLFTGQFMKFHHPPVRELEDGARMMFRSRHIFILLAGLINLGLGAYLAHSSQRWRKVLQIAGSALLLTASLLMIAAFFYEPAIEGMKRPLTLPAILGLLFGVACHVISGLREQKAQPLI